MRVNEDSAEKAVETLAVGSCSCVSRRARVFRSPKRPLAFLIKQLDYELKISIA